MAAAVATLSERMPGTIGTATRAAAAMCTDFGHAGALAAHEGQVVGVEGEIGVGEGGLGGRQHQPAAGFRLPCHKSVPGQVADEADLLQIVHARPSERAVGQVEPGRLDHMDVHPQAGAQSEQRAGVLRNVGLVEHESDHGQAKPWKRGAVNCRALSRRGIE